MTKTSGATGMAARLAAFALSALAVALAAGCATQSSAPGGAASATQPGSYACHGRFAVQYTQYGQPRNAYGNFDWSQSASGVRLELRNPLGQALAVVSALPDRAVLELPNRAPLMAGNVSALMQNALGFALPVQGMRYWLRAQAAPDTSARTTADERQPARVAQIVQDGWTIDYVMQSDADAPVSPGPVVKRLNLTRADPPLEIRLVLDQ